jgi:hypothetical protein
MSRKIFESIINEHLGKSEDLDPNIDKLKNIGENELEKNELLALLPEELREKSLRENFPVEHIKKIVEFREKKGYKTVLGFHVSDKDFKLDSDIQEGSDGEIHFTTDIQNLYMGKAPRFIYAIECSEKCMKTNDEALKWYTLKGSMKIIDKIKMTPEAVEALGAKFAECEYS